MLKLLDVLARLSTIGVLMALAGTAVAQQVYPNKPIRLIVPFPPGGGNDILARFIGKKLTDGLGQSVIVDNRPGGNTVIGSEALAKAAPDGYTLMLTNNTHVIIPSLLVLPFDATKDFAPVATIASAELVLAINPAVPANTLQEFIALAKSKPGQLNYGSGGTGNPNHLAGELFNMIAGVKIQHVPYKGAAAIPDLVSGQVQMHFPPAIAVLGHVRAGRLKAIAITGNTRSPALPQVPTFAQAGLPDFDMKQWYGVFAPAGTPKPIIDKLSADIGRILAMPDAKEIMAAQGIDPLVSTPGQFTALVSADLAKYAKIIKTANIKIE